MVKHIENRVEFGGEFCLLETSPEFKLYTAARGQLRYNSRYNSALLRLRTNGLKAIARGSKESHVNVLTGEVQLVGYPFSFVVDSWTFLHEREREEANHALFSFTVRGPRMITRVNFALFSDLADTIDAELTRLAMYNMFY